MALIYHIVASVNSECLGKGYYYNSTGFIGGFHREFLELKRSGFNKGAINWRFSLYMNLSLKPGARRLVPGARRLKYICEICVIFL
jgi:hypothetical protein